MKLFRFLPIAAILLLAASCGPSRYTAPDVNLSSVKEFAFFQPYSVVIGYDANNNAYYDAARSKTATNLVTGIIESERFPFSEVIPVDYSDSQADDVRWLCNFPEVDPTKIDRVRVPRSLRKKLDESGYRYGIFIYTHGFVRSKEYLQRQALVRSVGRIIDKVVEKTTGKYTYTSYPGSSPYGCTMFCAVVDGETDRVVYFSRDIMSDFAHPNDRSDVNAIVHRLLKDFTR